MNPGVVLALFGALILTPDTLLMRLSELTGGQIRNVAVSAAILAAATASLIDLDDIQLALKRELRQQGRLADSLRL